jgi:predicted Ser/Thr protein kinase
MLNLFMMNSIIVVGGGAAGIGAALEIAERGYQVQLIEKNQLGTGSSGRNPGRMGHGFHYEDFDTAKMYLRASIQVQRKYPRYLIGIEKDFSHPIRHGRYFITKDSKPTPQKILETYEKIKQEYIRLIEEDPGNEVFGPPDNFYRVLTAPEYENDVAEGVVAVGVETAEHLFDWQSFLKDIKQAIIDNPKINLLEETEVLEFQRGGQGEPKFNVLIKNKSSGEKGFISTDFIVNSTWENIEELNTGLGIKMMPEQRTNRLKSLLIVELPESLREKNSMFFCMGQHCMYSNLGNGDAMMTFAKLTNMEFSSDLVLSENAIRLLSHGASHEEAQGIAQDMLTGVATYIPDMAKAKIKDLKFGIVQTAGKLTSSDLSDPSNGFNKRDYDGIREEEVGLISNPCIKLFYFIRNGEKVADLVDAQYKRKH